MSGSEASGVALSKFSNEGDCHNYGPFLGCSRYLRP